MTTATTNTAGETIINDDKIIDGAVTEVKAIDNALVILNPTQYATELFQPFNDQLAALRRTAGRAKYDIATKDGFEKAKEFRALAVKIRTTAEKAKTEAKRPIDQSGKLLIEHFNKVAEAAKVEETKHDTAIKAREAAIEAEKQRKLDAERERVEALQGKVDAIRMFPSTLAGATSDQVRAAVEEWAAKSLTKAEYEDHFEDGVIALEATVRELRGMLASAIEREAAARKAEADRIELERLRAVQVQRDAEEAQRKVDAAAAAAEAQRQLDAQQAAIAKQQQIMQDLQDLQAKGMVDGDARELVAALDGLAKVDATEDKFGTMAGMANMAKSSGIALLTQKLLSRVTEAHVEAIADNEMYDAHVAALADDDMFSAHEAALDEDAERLAIAGQAQRTRLIVSQRDDEGQAEVVSLVEPEAPAVEQAPANDIVPNWWPTDTEIVTVLCAHYQVPVAQMIRRLASLATGVRSA